MNMYTNDTNLFVTLVLLIMLVCASPLQAEEAGLLSLPTMIPLKGGCFMMGDPYGRGDSDEAPVHRVCVGDFRLADVEVTQSLWETVMGENPSKMSKGCLQCPVERVNFNKIGKFLANLNAKTGRSFRLPTEAEWEYAATGGGKSDAEWSGVADEAALLDYAVFRANSGKTTQPVGSRRPNALGIHDMSGNVIEWVADWYSKDFYSISPERDPKGPQSGIRRVARGGGWDNTPVGLRVRNRFWIDPEISLIYLGFRLAE